MIRIQASSDRGVGVAFAGSVLLPLGLSVGATAQVYDWIPWSSSGPTAATATDPSLGTIVGSTSAPMGAITASFPIRFDGVEFTPAVTNAMSAGTEATGAVFSFTLDFTGVPNTDGVILGVGNFGHGTSDYPGYRMDMFDGLNQPMELTGVRSLQSCDHTWTVYNLMFNDDVALNTATGNFVVTTTPGFDQHNSDILLLRLPADVGRIEISTISAMSGGDTVNVVVAAPAQDAVPCDLNGDGVVDGDDLGTLLGQWGDCPGCSADFSGNGVVDGEDLGTLLGCWT